MIKSCESCKFRITGINKECALCGKSRKIWAARSGEIINDTQQSCANCAFESMPETSAPCNECAVSDMENTQFNWVKKFPEELRADTRQEGGTHYITLAVQPWDAMSAWMSPEAFKGFLKGNCIKYLARDKNGIEDLKKARHYLDKLIEEESK